MLVKELLQQWGIGNVDIISPTPTGGGRTWFVKTVAQKDYVLKGSDLKRSEREHDTLLGLSGTQVPVALPITTVAGDWYAQDRDGKVYCLYPRLPGDVVPEHYAGDAETRAQGFGRAIGLLHTCLQERADADEYPQMELVEHIDEWAIPRIRKGRTTVDASAVEQIWRDARSELEPIYVELPQQLIHRDAHSSNMLFSAGQLTGLLDFELVRRGPRIFDLCYCASSILVDGFEDFKKRQKWPSLFRSLVRGYSEFCPLTTSERLAAYGVTVAIELIFTAFWMDRSNEDGAVQCQRLLYWLATNRDALAI